MKTAPIAVAVAACLYAATAAAEIQLLPAGEFSARDGRPGNGRAWKLDDAQGRALVAALNARKTPLAIDYEHQTLAAADNGQPAPAAGWASRFEWRDGKGLFAIDVQWTDRAKQMIEAGEYRFISPVFAARKSDDVVTELLNAALVNTPALDGMAEVAQRIAARLAGITEEHTVNPLLQKLLQAIGLPAETTEDSALTAVAALKAKADDGDKKDVEIAALKAVSSKSDATTAELVKNLQAQVATLQNAAAQREVDEIVTAALKAGKLVPAQEKWARELGGKDVAQLKSFVDAAPVVSALAGNQSGSRGAADAGSTDARAIAAKAQAHIAEQAKLGVAVTAAQAVAHVTRG